MKPAPTPMCDRPLDALAHTLYDDKGTLVAAAFPPGEADTARRLAACWNALRGIPTEDIERGRIAVQKINTVAVGVNHGAISLS